jgi:hypothetical protein
MRAFFIVFRFIPNFPAKQLSWWLPLTLFSSKNSKNYTIFTVLSFNPDCPLGICNENQKPNKI